jgi:hypothetical protein
LKKISLSIETTSRVGCANSNNNNKNIEIRDEITGEEEEQSTAVG